MEGPCGSADRFDQAQCLCGGSRILRKLGKLMRERDMAAQWDIYIQSLRHTHRRKTRLMEVLDGLSPVEKHVGREDTQRKK